MAYRVRLIRTGEENLTYELGGICADNENQAIDKAKKQIVEQGYWFPWESNIEKRYDVLKAESVVLDNI